MDDTQPNTGELLLQWRDATRAAELAERLAEIAAQAADRADRGGLASDEIARMASEAALAAERAARSARRAARQAADADHTTARDSDAHARGRYHEAERGSGQRQRPPRRHYHLAHDSRPDPRRDRGGNRPLRRPS